MGARAMVKLELEVQLADRWTNDTSVAQVFSQAQAEAVGKVEQQFAKDPNIRVVREATRVTAVLYEKEPTGKGG